MDQQGNREKSNDSELLVKKQQLHWLLQITKAINYNMPATQLFEIYEITKLDINRIYRYIDKYTKENVADVEDNVEEKSDTDE